MQLGAALGGLALESSMLGLAHALANPLTDRFGAVHGQAVGVVLPHVVRFNALDPSAGDVYRDLAAAGGVAPEGAPALEAAEAIAAAIEALLEFGEGPRTPAAFGASEAEIPLLAEEAARQLPARFNPRAATVSDLEALYRRAFQGAGLAALERGRT
jgi:alcohol dehydrogenase